jgi:CheY-like chemotaxis protein
MPSPLPVTIVIIEEDPEHTRILEHSIRRAHITNEIVLLRDGHEALLYLCPERPNPEPPQDLPYLIVLDLQLSVVDGYTVLERIKRDARTQHIPVIILTTVEEPADIERCAALGCHIHLTKPIEYNQFVQAIRQLGLFVSIVPLPTGILAPPRRGQWRWHEQGA